MTGVSILIAKHATWDRVTQMRAVADFSKYGISYSCNMNFSTTEVREIYQPRTLILELDLSDSHLCCRLKNQST